MEFDKTKTRNIKTFLKKAYKLNAELNEAYVSNGHDVIDRLVSERIKSISNTLNVIKRQLCDIIRQIDDAQEIDVLIYRYVYFYKWDDIGNKLNCTTKKVHGIHADALSSLARLDIWEEGDAN